jgi:hypothetical protein
MLASDTTVVGERPLYDHPSSPTQLYRVIWTPSFHPFGARLGSRRLLTGCLPSPELSRSVVSAYRRVHAA